VIVATRPHFWYNRLVVKMDDARKREAMTGHVNLTGDGSVEWGPYRRHGMLQIIVEDGWDNGVCVELHPRRPRHPDRRSPEGARRDDGGIMTVPAIVKQGLAQMDDAGLQRVIDHEGAMLLNGNMIARRATGDRCGSGSPWGSGPKASRWDCSMRGIAFLAVTISTSIRGKTARSATRKGSPTAPRTTSARRAGRF